MSTIRKAPDQTWHKHFSESFGEYAHAHTKGDEDHKHGLPPEGNQKYLGVVNEPGKTSKPA